MTNERKRNAYKRAWDREHYRGVCPCGTQTARRANQVCGDCRREMVAVGAAMRRERIHELWHEGQSLQEIAQTLSLGNWRSAGVLVTEMRADGWDMPYRHRPYRQPERDAPPPAQTRP